MSLAAMRWATTQKSFISPELLKILYVIADNANINGESEISIALLEANINGVDTGHLLKSLNELFCYQIINFKPSRYAATNEQAFICAVLPLSKEEK